ncbi:hypothetical protein HGRIS_000077 [Hohenbuehelia grisea]|uniref:Major facilitator superfamily (MFS) profile domain-containing protein n=1 Tax=Hohenbuehelia grisea TaxID=104357 RepID=A0ABR3JS41_9AGAR
MTEQHGDRKDEHGDCQSKDESLVATPPRRSPLRSVLIVATCTTAMVVNGSNMASGNIALPTIGRELDVPEAQLQWVVAAYSLASGCLLLLFGRVADLYGRKRTFVAGCAWLIILSIACSLSNDGITLSILRGLQGVGGAATIPSSIGILSHSFPPSRARSIAFATFAAGAPVGGAYGYQIGGVLTEFTRKTWRSTFYAAAGLAFLNLILGLIFMDPDVRSSEIDRRIDWLGALLVTAGLVLIFFVLGSGEVASKQWVTPYIIALLILGVLFLCLFVVWQRYLEQISDTLDYKPKWSTPPPLIKPSLWGRANGRMAAIMIIALLNFCCFIGWNFWQQLYYQRFLGLSPIHTAIRLLPLFVTGVLCNVLVAFVVSRVPIVYLLGFGTLITSCAALLFAQIQPSAPYWAFGFPAAILSVVGSDFTFASGTLFITRAALPHEQSVGGAVFQTMVQLGTAMGVTITTVVFNRVLDHELASLDLPANFPQQDVPKDRLLKCFHSAQWTAFAFGITAVLVSTIFFRGVGIVGHRKTQHSASASGHERVVPSQATGDAKMEKVPKH